MREYTLGSDGQGAIPSFTRPCDTRTEHVRPEDDILRELRLIRIALQTIAKQEVSE